MTMTQAAQETQFVTFGLGEETFAIPVTSVREILDHQDTFRIPQGPEFLLGLLNVRGHGVPVVDLRMRLGMAATLKTSFTRILVIDIAMDDRILTLGLLVDSVHEVAPFKAAEIGGAPDIGLPWGSDYINGVIKRDKGFVVIIDLKRLFSDAGAFFEPVQPRSSAA